MTTSGKPGAEAVRSTTLDAIAAGEAAELQGDYHTAAAAYQILSDDPDLAVQADGHFRLGVVAWRQNRFEVALQQHIRARELARHAGRADIEARAENGIGAVHYAQGELAQARASYQIALELTSDPVLHGSFLLNLGVLANIEGDLDRALEYYLRARAILRDNGDQKNEALALGNLLMLHADRREWDDAEHASREALEVFEHLGDRASIAEVLRARSEVLAAQENFSEAIRHCQLAITIFTDLGNDLGRAGAQLLRGRYLRLSGEVAQSEVSLIDSCRTAKHYRDKLLEAESCRELAALYLGTHKEKEAARWRARAVKLFSDLGAQREVAALEGGGD